MNIADWSSSLPRGQRFFAATFLTIGFIVAMVAVSAVFIFLLSFLPNIFGLLLPVAAIFYVIFLLFYNKDSRPMCPHCNQRYTPKDDTH